MEGKTSSSADEPAEGDVWEVRTRLYDRREIALEQLETALRLWFERADYFSIITLAGAAEEIFGKSVSAQGRESSLDSLRSTMPAMHKFLWDEEIDPKEVTRRANRVKNQSKHLDASEDPSVLVDAKGEARTMLYRAIDNYCSLSADRKTPAMVQFYEEQYARIEKYAEKTSAED